MLSKKVCRSVCYSVVVLSGLISDSTFAMGKKHHEMLSSDISVETVRVSKENSRSGIASIFPKYVSCENGFTGTQDGNKIYIQINSSGGAGDYKHTLTYQLSDSYELE